MEGIRLVLRLRVAVVVLVEVRGLETLVAQERLIKAMQAVVVLVRQAAAVVARVVWERTPLPRMAQMAVQEYQAP